MPSQEKWEEEAEETENDVIALAPAPGEFIGFTEIPRVIVAVTRGFVRDSEDRSQGKWLGD